MVFFEAFVNSFEKFIFQKLFLWSGFTYSFPL